MDTNKIAVEDNVIFLPVTFRNFETEVLRLFVAELRGFSPNGRVYSYCRRSPKIEVGCWLPYQPHCPFFAHLLALRCRSLRSFRPSNMLCCAGSSRRIASLFLLSPLPFLLLYAAKNFQKFPPLSNFATFWEVFLLICSNSRDEIISIWVLLRITEWILKLRIQYIPHIMCNANLKTRRLQVQSPQRMFLEWNS